MGLSMRRMSRFSWLRVFITLAICLIASPGTVQAPLAVVHAASASAKSTSAYMPTSKRDFTQDEVLISYCTSCGFQQNFAQVKEYLEDKYPHLIDRVTGVKEAVDPMKALLANVLGYAQLVAMVLMIFGEFIFRKLGLDATLLQKALDNRIGCFAVILLMGSVSQGLISTGAFEVYFNQELVFSKLQAGRWPTLEELSSLLEAKGLNTLS